MEAEGILEVNFSWTPDKPGKIRETVEFKVFGLRQYSVRAVLVGECRAAAQAKKVRKSFRGKLLLEQH